MRLGLAEQKDRYANLDHIPIMERKRGLNGLAVHFCAIFASQVGQNEVFLSLHNGGMRGRNRWVLQSYGEVQFTCIAPDHGDSTGKSDMQIFMWTGSRDQM